MDGIAYALVHLENMCFNEVRQLRDTDVSNCNIIQAIYNVVLLLGFSCKVFGDEQPLLANLTTKNINEKLLRYEKYDRAAVSTDNEICSTVAKDILMKNGSAVDSAIAALFCLGVIQFHSTGIGGGGFMLVYKRKDKQFTAYNFRETVPMNTDLKEFENDRKKTKIGGLAVAVPSEVKGMRMAWKKFGKLEWADLVQPSIDIAEKGFPATRHMVFHANRKSHKITDEALRSLITEKDGSIVKVGATIKRPAYANTLRIIKDNPDAMYEGELAKDISDDVKSAGGVMTTDDLKNYAVKLEDVMKLKLDNLTLHTLPLPSGGPILIHMLMVCREFNFTKSDMATIEKATLTYHRIAEAFKFSHAYRSHFSDPDFAVHKEEFDKLCKAVIDPDVARYQKEKINDTTTHDRQFYGTLLRGKEDHGTTHVSILAENGDAVAASSSINDKFGALFSSKKTGIVYNNEIGDAHTLSSPWRKFTWSEENAPRPGSRPLSAMVPTILTDENGDVRMVIGGSGGSKITLSVAWVIMMKLWFGMDLGNAVLMSRPYHTFFPEQLKLERAFPIKDKIIEGLKKRNHKVKESKQCGCGVIQIIYKDCGSCQIFAKADPRKYGGTDGY
eukprot:gene15621-6904_t